MVDFAKLRANKGNSAVQMAEQIKRQEKKGFADDRIWKHTWAKNKDGVNVSENVIRILPAPYVDEVSLSEGKIVSVTPLITVERFFFKTPLGQFFVANSMSTFGEKTPVADHDGPLWNKWKEQGKPDGVLKNTLVNRLPKQETYVNILVINDVNTPENNGKVFLYKLPKAIMKMINAALKPKFAASSPVDPYNMWDGVNLLLNLSGEERKFGGKDVVAPLFDDVTWSTPCELGSDEVKEASWRASHSLMDMLDRSHFPSYDDLNKKFTEAMYGCAAGAAQNTNAANNGGQQYTVGGQQEEPAKKEEQKLQSKAEVPVDEQKAEEPIGDNLDDFEAMLNA